MEGMLKVPGEQDRIEEARKRAREENARIAAEIGQMEELEKCHPILGREKWLKRSQFIRMVVCQGLK